MEAWEGYKLLAELSEEEKDELRDNCYQKLLDDGTINPDEYDGVTDEMLDEEYAGISFVYEDFFCNVLPSF